MIPIEVSTIGIYAVYQNPLRCSFVHCATLLYRYKNKLFYRRSTTIDRRSTKEHEDPVLQDDHEDPALQDEHEDPMSTKILLCRMSTKIQ